MQKKRILYIESNRDGTIGGSYYSLFYLIEGLDKETYEPVVMFYENNSLISKFEKIAKKVIIFDHESPFSGCLRNFDDFVKFIPRFVRDILWAQFEITKKIDEIKPDIVHLNNSYAANHDWVLACKRKGVKIIAHDRGTRPPASLQTRFFVRFLDAIITVSDAYKHFIVEEQLKPMRLRRVYNGLSIESFEKYRSLQDRHKVREKLGIDKNTILVGIVGNIDYWKGQLVFAKMMDSVLKEQNQGVDVQGVIIGNTSRGAEAYELEVQDYLRKRGLDNKVKLLGFRQDIPQLLNAMDIFVHASVEPEPFGRVILEAMAMENPIVATKPGGPSEIIEEGITGYLVPMNDYISMKDAVIRYIREPRRAKEMGLAARKAAEKNFSVSHMVTNIERVYREIF